MVSYVSILVDRARIKAKYRLGLVFSDIITFPEGQASLVRINSTRLEILDCYLQLLVRQSNQHQGFCHQH